jgi:hypothetical protein
MRQTKINSGFSIYKAVTAVFLLLLLPAFVLAQSASFQDLPEDHWAFSDVDFLVNQGYMEGYPDGTFKGRKVTTRYDVALILARILKRMEEKKATLDAATEEERAALSRLTKEFRDELGLLDVRVDSLERRMVDNENSLRNLENRLPKVKISGFYRGRGQYIIDPDTVYRNEYGDEETFQDPGLVTFYQQIYLRFTGQPLGDKIETFYELYGFMKGYTWNKTVYNDTGKDYGQNPFDNIDDYVRYIQNDRYVRTNKLHFVSRAKSMKVRVFGGESITGIDNPMNILTEDTYVVDPWQGVEVSGSESGVSYQGSVLKNDLNRGTSDETDMIAGRVVWKLPEKFSEDTFSIGTSYAEKIYDYKTRGNSNTVRGVDMNYSTDRAGKIQATAEFLTSTDYHYDTATKGHKNLGDQGTRFDVSMQNGGFTGTIKHYDFGNDFRAVMAPIWAYDVGDDDDYPNSLGVDSNYGNPDFEGEKLTRFSLNYDFGNKLLAIANNLSLEATYLSKTWEEDPYSPADTDGFSGRKFTFQVLSDFTDNTTLKYDFTQKWDALIDEAGWTANAVELNLRLSDAVSTKGKMFVLSDPDDKFEQNGSIYDYDERIGYFEINSDINPRVYAKGSVEHQVRWANAPKENIRVDYIGEATYNLTPTTSFTGGVQHIDYEDRYDGGNSTLANAIIAELKKNFTNKFRGRAFYSRGVIDYKDGLTDSLDRENIYGELIYDVSRDATITFKYGYDYPDNWRWDISSWDNGRDKEYIETQKMFIFEARTNF